MTIQDLPYQSLKLISEKIIRVRSNLTLYQQKVNILKRNVTESIMQQSKIHSFRHPIKNCLTYKEGNKCDPLINR